MKYCFIINPVAGDMKNIENYPDKIEQVCKAKGLDYELLVTEYSEHATQLARQCAEQYEQVRIFSCGGDGTLSEVLNGIVGCDNVELGCMPCGSGNDYVKVYGAKEEFLDLENYICADSVKVDLIHTGERYSVNICSLGLDAIICDRAVKYIRAGKYAGSKAYDKATIRSLFGKRANNLKITIDDQDTFEGKFLFSLAASGSCYGGGYNSAPMADPSDGLLDFVLVKNVPLLKLPSLISPYKKGTYVNDRRFKKIAIIRRGKKMKIESKKEAIVNIDGECYRKTEITFEVAPGAIRFIVPKSYSDKIKA